MQTDVDYNEREAHWKAVFKNWFTQLSAVNPRWSIPDTLVWLAGMKKAKLEENQKLSWQIQFILNQLQTLTKSKNNLTNSTLGESSSNIGDSSSFLSAAELGSLNSNTFLDLAIHELFQKINEIPEGKNAFSELRRAERAIKMRLRGDEVGNKIILSMDEKFDSCSSMMSLKDYLVALKDTFFAPFPKLQEKLKILLIKWAANKCPMRPVLELLAENAEISAIKTILNERMLTKELASTWSLGGLSQSARKVALNALNSNFKRRRTFNGGKPQSSYRRPDYRGRDRFRGENRTDRRDTREQRYQKGGRSRHSVGIFQAFNIYFLKHHA